MVKRIVITAAVLSFLAAMPAGTSAAGDDDEFDELEKAVVITGGIFSGVNLLISLNNSSRLGSGDPSMLGGAGGLVLGSASSVFGASMLFWEEPWVKAAGAVTVAAGIYTAYVGVKSLAAVRRKNLERMRKEERGLSLRPIFIEDGHGSFVPGIQVGMRF